MSNHDMPPADAVAAFSAEQDAAERSPAQPADADRIDTGDAPVETEPPHAKHERSGRMQN